MIRFVSEASEDVALGETGKALKLVTSSAVSHPEDLGAQVRLSRMMVSAGWQALAWAYQFDSFGRRFHGNWNVFGTDSSDSWGYLHTGERWRYARFSMEDAVG
jgi:hypothetical protein